MTVHAPELTRFAAREMAQTWVARFAEILASGENGKLALVFHAEGCWRDCVAVSRRIQTAEGIDQIRSLSGRIEAPNRPRNLQLSGGVRQQNGMIVGEFTFTTEVFKGTAHFRLLGDKCYLLATFAEGLVTPVSMVSDGRFDAHTIIIGAGHAGLSLAACLQKLGIQPIVYDAQDQPGDSWRNRYDALKLHDPTVFNHLPHQPFPASWPEFTSKDLLADFLTSYATTQNLKVVPRTRCVNAVFDNGLWSVSLESEGVRRTVTCCNLVMAMGRFGKPHIPNFDGADQFKGHIGHSSNFRSGARYAGRRVSVVGAGNTGFDVALDLAEHGADVTIVQRTPISLITQRALADMLLGQYPNGAGGCGHLNAIDRSIHAMPARLYLKAAAAAWKTVCALDADLYKRLTQAGLMLDDGYENSGVFGQAHLSATGMVVDQGTAEWIADGRIAVRSGSVSRMTPTGLLLDTGVHIDADSVICATGFLPVTNALTDVLGNEQVECLGNVWGVGQGSKDDPGPWTGEQRNMWTPTALQGLWFHGGSLGASRFYSHLLALQIAA